MTEQSPDYLPQDAKPEALRLANVALPRYKIGYQSDEWGMGGRTPTGIPSPEGEWVRFEDAQAVATGYAAARLEIESLQARVQELGQAARSWKTKAQELEAQLDAVGAGGVEPLRKSNPVEKYQIVEPQPAEVGPVPVAWRARKEGFTSGWYDYTNIGLQVNAWEKQGLQVEPLYPEQQPPAEVQQTHTDMELAELILSDCGISTNNTSLLNRVAIRICKHWAVVLDDEDESPEPIPDAIKAESAFAFIGAIYSNGKNGVIVRHSPSGYFLEQYPCNGLVYASWFASLRDVGAFLVDHGFVMVKEPATQDQPIEVQHLPADDTEGGAV